jgi:hypothetical protein
MKKKCMAIWVLTTITFISLVHLIEAITVIILNTPIRLLQLYPFINEPLKALTPYAYFYISAITTVVLWGVTCLVAFQSPIEHYLNQREMTETQLQDKSELLDRMYETVESDHQTLTQLSDLIHKMQKGMKDEQTPKPTTLTPPKEVANLKNKPSQLKSPISKPVAQPAQAATKSQKIPLLHRKQKATEKKSENQEIKIDTHSAVMPMRKMT